MSSIDWDNAPEGAEFYCGGFFIKNGVFTRPMRYLPTGGWEIIDIDYEACSKMPDFERRPQTQQSAPAIAQEAFLQQVDTQAALTAKSVLESGLRILTERGQQYGSGERECSFPQVAQAFNAITGRDLAGSDVCLILAMVKQVGQYAQPERFHEDSAVDGVNYTALQAELLKRERSE